ncbi:conjugal transfer protein TraF [Acidithiobacillus ferrooxidans]|nr:conjugal transfer protein TraF [Acidithiobacillus ferrooxidans]
MSKAPFLSRKGIVGAGLVLAALATVAAPLGLSALRRHYAVSMDPQWASCLPWSTFLVRYGPPASIRRGSLVLFHDRALDPTGYGGYPAVKYVAGVPGSVVRIEKHAVWIDGHFWGRMWLLPWMRMKHLEPLHPGTFVVPKGEYLLMGSTPGSYDGRYWGFVPKKNIYGLAWPL